MNKAQKGDDGKIRCKWSLMAPDFLDYHDKEWGFPVKDDYRLFEKLCLESFQSGLSWRTVLAKRDEFRVELKCHVTAIPWVSWCNSAQHKTYLALAVVASFRKERRKPLHKFVFLDVKSPAPLSLPDFSRNQVGPEAKTLAILTFGLQMGLSYSQIY